MHFYWWIVKCLKHHIGAWLAHSGTDQVDTYTQDADRDALIEDSMKALDWK